MSLKFSRFASLVPILVLSGVWVPGVFSQTAEPGLPPKVELSHKLPPTASNALGTAPNVDLGSIDDNLRDVPAPRKGILRVATHRAMSATSMSQGTWQALSDGTFVWRLDISSQNALGIRVHFTSFSTGYGKVWVHDTNTPARQTFGPYSGKGRNNSGDFWSDAVFSNQVEIEYVPAAGAATSGNPPFTISEILHIWQLGPYAAPRQNGASQSTTTDQSTFQIVPTRTTTAGSPNYSCFVDAACEDSSSVVAEAAPSTAIILFSDYQCSATILNTANTEPEILTAGHCVNTETDAEGTEAFFNVQDSSCNANEDTTLTTQILASFPSADGVELLAYVDEPFLGGSDYQTQITNDIDYSLILLNNFPASSDFVLSGYTATAQTTGASVTSLSYPDGLYMQYAAGTVEAGSTSDQSFFDNAYEIDQSTNGRVDEGSSGSGIFDGGGHLVGLLSTADACTGNNCTSCDAGTPFDAWYTKFSSIYPYISQYLEQPLVPSLPVNTSIFWASPNPVTANGASRVETTLYINDPSLSSFQVRVGSPSGALFTQGEGTGSATTGNWVTNDAVFYLQDVSNGKSLTLANTVATVKVTFNQLSFTANPSNIPANDYAITTLSWDTPNNSSVQVRVGSPTGPLFAEGGYVGSATTGYWATAGMKFYLVDGNSGDTITTLTLGTAIDVVNSGAAVLYASANPIYVNSGTTHAQTTLYWDAISTYSSVEVRVGSPSGPLFTAGGNSGSAATGDWVTNGMTFYLQNVTGGLPLTSANTLATATVSVVQ